MKKHNKRDKPYPPCGMGLPDCFALDGQGRCTALEDTAFRCGRCPFCKTTDQVVAERAASLQYLKDAGRDDLIETYHMEPKTRGKKNEVMLDV